MKFLFGLAITGACIGGFILVAGLAFSTGAPQEAAVAGIAIAFAAIPYCIARAAEGIQAQDRLRDEREDQRTQTKLLAAIANGVGVRGDEATRAIEQ